MTYELHQGDARKLDMIADESVDLIVTSPPYFGQRSYQDGGEHYEGQIGSEPTPQQFLDALFEVTKACWRVLKPSGSMFVNLGDKRSGSGAPGTTSGLGVTPQGNRSGMKPPPARATWSDDDRPGREVVNGYPKAAFGRAKSKQLIPHRFAIGCEDGLGDPDGVGWVMRQELVWSKPNGMPESVTDRCRDSHEYFFHLTRSGDYFAAVDELREDPSGYHRGPGIAVPDVPGQKVRTMLHTSNPLGKLPPSVWPIPTEPLSVPAELGVDHFAAFPSEWPRRLILGWSPAALCLECGHGRAAVIEATRSSDNRMGKYDASARKPGHWAQSAPGVGTDRTVVGYACACPTTDAPTRSAVVLDPFSGTGTTVMVAHALGRHGIGVDLSSDYLRLAEWRILHDPRSSKVRERTNANRQGVLL